MSELKYYKFQEEAISFCMKRKSAFLALEAGLGKTIIVCGVINSMKAQSALIVCPAFLSLNWERELSKWCPGIPVNIVTPSTKKNARNISGITIISYELMRRMAPWYSQFNFDVLVWDESHYVSHANSLRSKASRLLKGKKKICLSGTPIQSRVINLWHQLHLLNNVLFNDYWHFALKYCAAKKESYGWNVSGCSNAEELKVLLKKELMLIMKKKDVLPELPQKIRQIIELPCANYRKILEEERKFYNEIIQSLGPVPKPNDLSDTFGNEYQDELLHMIGNNQYDLSQIATLRKRTGLLKAPAIIEHVQNLISAGNKVVLFTHHHDFMDEMRKRLPDGLWCDGRIKMKDRDSIVYRFQTDNTKRLLIAGLSSLNVGVTLTEANIVVIGELPWLPNDVTQGEDRIHRIGLQHSVIIQHMVLQGSLDLDIAQTLINKQSIINSIID